MLIKLVVALVTIGLCISMHPRRPWHDDRIVMQQFQPWNGRSYAFQFLTKFGNSRHEKAEMRKDNHGREFLDVRGEYSYPTSNGLLRKVTYTANNEGYNEKTTMLTTEPHFDHPRNNLDSQTESYKGPVQINQMHNSVHLNNDKENTKTQEKVTNNEKNLIKVNESSVDQIVSNVLDDNERINFPTESPNLSVGTTALPVSTTDMSTTPFNETSDYYYDELGNRIGGVPPAVLGSLLG